MPSNIVRACGARDDITEVSYNTLRYTTLKYTHKDRSKKGECYMDETDKTDSYKYGQEEENGDEKA